MSLMISNRLHFLQHQFLEIHVDRQYQFDTIDVNFEFESLEGLKEHSNISLRQ